MRMDLSVKVEKKLISEMLGSADYVVNAEKAGHVGTHFDVMDKVFSIDNMITKGRLFDISLIKTGQVTVADLDLSAVGEGDFVMFHSGLLNNLGYGSKEYFSTYTELSNSLIDALIDKKISFIGVDMAGAKGPADHPRIDQYCADRGIFIIENLNNLAPLLKETAGKPFTVYTFPVNMSGFSGLPCRVVAEV